MKTLEQTRDELALPEIYSACAHPQSVWFEEHWRPVFEKMRARIGLAEHRANAHVEHSEGLEQVIQDLTARLADAEHRCELAAQDMLRAERERDELKEIHKEVAELHRAEYEAGQKKIDRCHKKLAAAEAELKGLVLRSRKCINCGTEIFGWSSK